MADSEVVVRQIFDKIAHEQGLQSHSVTVRHIKSDGSNYTSMLYAAIIKSDDRDDLHLFAKVANVDEEARQKSTLARMYIVERKIYRDLGEIFNRLQEKHDVPLLDRFKMPKFYGSGDQYLRETIVLENLRGKGYRDYDRFKSADWTNAAKCVEELAKWHALSFAYAAEDPNRYEDLLEEMVYSTKTNEEQLSRYSDKLIATISPIVKEENRERFIKFFKDKRYLHYMKPVKKAVLTHGDYRLSNLMHRIYEGKLDIIAIDFQCVYTGCVATDLIFYIMTGTDEEFRRQYYSQLTTLYYVKLCEALRRFHVDPKTVYPREDFEYELKKVLPFGLLVATYVLPLAVVDAELAPKMEQLVTIEYNVEMNELYVERINGIVENYIDWGIL